MDTFRKNYTVYYTMLNVTALWPYDESLLSRIQRVLFPLLIISLISIQVIKLRTVEMSLYNIVTMLSLTCPMALFFLRFIGFTINRSGMRDVLTMIENDYKSVKDSVENDIFLKHIVVARRVIMAFLGLSCSLIAYLILVLLLPTILRSNHQPYYLRQFGFFFYERGLLTDCVAIQLTIGFTLGLLSVSSTESVLAIFSSHICALLEIASYRIETEINNAVVSTKLKLIEVQSAVEFHNQVLRLLTDLVGQMTIQYLIAIITVILSFAVNLYRLLLAVKKGDDFQNIFFSVNDCLLHFIIMYLNNFVGQRLSDTSMMIFEKMLEESCLDCLSCLFSIPSCKTTRENLLYKEMMSSSFSYFTVLYSTQ
ncbi:uncharacterized protein LOC144478221 isoform X2 [Augochlora pura]